MERETGHDRRGAERQEVDLACSLTRSGAGSAITGRTLDLGPGGMCIATCRPLRVDEVLDFDLPTPGAADQEHITGRARVMREQTFGVYAMRFERLPAPARDRVRALADEHAVRPARA